MKTKIAKQKIFNTFVKRLSPLSNYYLPTSMIRNIDVEPIAVCDLKCDFCQVPGWDRAKNTKAMSLDLFKLVIDQFPNLYLIKLQGMGEPFLNKDMVNMIEYATSKNIMTITTSHGGRLNSELIKGIISAGLDFIDFSFDGAKKETYEKARVNSIYEKVVGNISELCAEKKKLNSKLRTRMVCLISDNQILNEIPDLVLLGKTVGIDAIHIKGRIKNWEKLQDGKYSFTTNYSDGDNTFNEIMLESQKIAFEADIKFTFGTSGQSYSKNNPCRWPWRSLYISTEGIIVPCCVVGVPETWNMGSLVDKPLKELWNGSEYKKMRKLMSQYSRGKINNSGLHHLCQSCYLKN
jgi:pyrroloquinoline quinone biosynthesis protein E|tara:strand:+ start:290 stop:1336 length:1047 start_codon:yes stop_codon:yes gene_type:complete